jgi:hypothetical protein
MGRKSKALAPRRKRMARASRLQSGRHWLKTYSGKHVVRSYARWFGVDLMCALKELQLLGIRFEPEYVEALRRTAAAGSRRRREVARDGKSVGAEREWNQEFAYIAGYTEAGFPFGVTWEEFETLSGAEDVPVERDGWNA